MQGFNQRLAAQFVSVELGHDAKVDDAHSTPLLLALTTASHRWKEELP